LPPVDDLIEIAFKIGAQTAFCDKVFFRDYNIGSRQALDKEGPPGKLG